MPTANASPLRPLDLDCPRGVPLYVHFPFCVVKCTYCDFYSTAEHRGESTVGQDLSFVLDELLREAERRAPADPVTVFLGGGTPSIHSPEDLARFLDRLDDACGFRRSAVEVTMESNPESLDLETAQAAREGGVVRLSIGVQSLDPVTLEQFGRAHDRHQARRAFEHARSAGMPQVNVDLIYGAPTQRAGSWSQELAEVLAWRPDHVSAYSLAFEQGTLMTKWRSLGSIQELPEDVALTFFLEARRSLEQAGYHPYEISNFTSKELCLHNLNAWWNGPYVGIGPSAVSSVGGVRFGHPRSINAWRGALENEGPRVPMDWEERLTTERRIGETWWLGLRLTEGVDAHRAADTTWERETFLARAAEARARHHGFHEEPSPDERSPADGPAVACAQRLTEEGWLVRSGSRWRLADHAWPLADAISSRFLDLA